ncbi:MliC family protein [Pollutibacter soli]|uniref:MliC family protein n=1 Tax=Pollutibacter soli TaxID=3034157 RepID=UPI003014010B
MGKSVLLRYNIFLLLLPSFMVISCNSETTKAISTVEYSCGNGSKLTVSYYKDSAVVKGSINGIDVNWSLPQVEAASGIRYSDGKLQVWSKGKSAQIDPGDGQGFECSE